MEINLDNLKRQFEENPVFVIGATAALLTAVSQLLNATTNARNSRIWSKEVNRRVQKSDKK